MEQNQSPGSAGRFTHDLRWRACSNSPVDLDLCTYIVSIQTLTSETTYHMYHT